MACICCSTSWSLISLFPTLGSNWPTLFNSSLQVSSDGFPDSVLSSLALFAPGIAWGAGLTNSERANFGLARNLLLTASVSAVQHGLIVLHVNDMPGCQWYGHHLPFLRISCAMDLANFLGYTSVNLVLNMISPFWLWHEPSIFWWGCRLSHDMPWNLVYKGAYVVKTDIPFFMWTWVSGQRRSPARHMSNWQAWVCIWISAKLGCLNIKDRCGCSQWKWSPFPTWWRYNTIPKLSWYSNWRLCSWYNSWWKRDRDAFNWDHDDQGPHVGLYHMCFGRCRMIFWNSCWRPSDVDTSPWLSPKRKACPSAFRTRWVRGDLSLHMTSPKSHLGPVGFTSFLTCWSSFIIMVTILFTS